MNYSISLRRATSVAANFFVRFLSTTSVDERKQRQFAIRLEQLMASRLQHHWYPEEPRRGQAFRCIRINSLSKREALIEEALTASSLTYDDIHLPLELTVWIDPDEVACRFGEDEGSIASLMSFTRNKKRSDYQSEAFRPVVLVRIPAQRTLLIRFEMQCVFIKK